MGVPGLFAYLKRRYPQICSVPDPPRQNAADDTIDPTGHSSSGRRIDNLYIDMNHIIHSCTHASVAKDRYNLTQPEIFEGMGAYLDLLLEVVGPRSLVLVAVDGVAPRAKMSQQRTRRFLSSYVSDITDRVDKEVRREMESEAGGRLELANVGKLDPNIITPGTRFMDSVATWLRHWARRKVEGEPRYAGVKFIVSDASEPGEGEHKIMRFLRSLRCAPGYDPATSHLVYGQDADLLLLALLCHEPRFVVMREWFDKGKPAERGAKGGGGGGGGSSMLARLAAAGAPPAAGPAAGPGGCAPLVTLAGARPGDHLKLPEFEQVDIGVLRECLQWEFSELVGPPGPAEDSSSGDNDDDGDDDDDDGGEEEEDEEEDAQTAAAVAVAAAARRPKVPGVTCESVLDDVVVLTFLAGNDFLPNVPSIDIYDSPNGLDVLFTTYKHMLPELGGPIASGGTVNTSRLQRLLSRLVRDEEPAYRRRAEYRKRKAQEETNKKAALETQLCALFDQGLSMGELPPGFDIDNLDEMLATMTPSMMKALGLESGAGMGGDGSPPLDLPSLTPGQLAEELAKRVGERVQERVMGGDPWAQDPIGMDLPGYRDRYYQARFPELVAEGKDVDKIAAAACRQYVDGICWVYRYYSMGPAVVRWLPDGAAAAQQEKPGGGAKGSSGGGGGGERDGSSWTWYYPYHYAPLMQDLAKPSNAASRAGKSTLQAAFIPLTRGLARPASCPVAEWAPKNGPVRPLLQLMCVLPAKSASEALPRDLANLVVIAQEMDDGPAPTAATAPQQAAGERPAAHAARRQQRAGGGGRFGARRGRGRGGGGGGGAGFALLEEVEEEDSGGDDDSDDSDGGGGSSSGDEDGGSGDLAPEFAGDLAMSAMLLAEQLRRAFPSDIEPLVDLTGKKWLHTGVVRLPVADPTRVAKVLQQLLRCGADLSDEEAARNRFRPADVIAAAGDALAAGATAAAVQQAVAAAEGGGGRGEGGEEGDAATTWARAVWRMLVAAPRPAPPPVAASGPAVASVALVAGPAVAGGPGLASVAPTQRLPLLAPPQPLVPQPLVQQQQQQRPQPLVPLLAQPLSGSVSAPPTAALLSAPPSLLAAQLSAPVLPPAPARVAGLGALGELLGRRGLVGGAAVEVRQMTLDLAGLVPPPHACSLLPGAEAPPLTVTAAKWRRIAHANARSSAYAERVLGFAKAQDAAAAGGHRLERGRGRGRGGERGRGGGCRWEGGHRDGGRGRTGGGGRGGGGGGARGGAGGGGGGGFYSAGYASGGGGGYAVAGAFAYGSGAAGGFAGGGCYAGGGGGGGYYGGYDGSYFGSVEYLQPPQQQQAQLGGRGRGFQNGGGAQGPLRGRGRRG